jgi:ribosomal subunit interface protein
MQQTTSWFQGRNNLAAWLQGEAIERNVPMQLVVRSVNLDGSEALHEYATRRVERVLRFQGTPATRALVLFRDMNGPRGGSDMHCRIRLVGPRMRLSVEALHADPYAAVDIASERLAHALRRDAGRKRDASSGPRGLRALVQELPEAPPEQEAAE